MRRIVVRMLGDPSIRGRLHRDIPVRLHQEPPFTHLSGKLVEVDCPVHDDVPVLGGVVARGQLQLGRVDRNAAGSQEIERPEHEVQTRRGTPEVLERATRPGEVELPEVVRDCVHVDVPDGDVALEHVVRNDLGHREGPEAREVLAGCDPGVGPAPGWLEIRREGRDPVGCEHGRYRLLTHAESDRTATLGQQSVLLGRPEHVDELPYLAMQPCPRRLAPRQDHALRKHEAVKSLEGGARKLGGRDHLRDDMIEARWRTAGVVLGQIESAEVVRRRTCAVLEARESLLEPVEAVVEVATEGSGGGTSKARDWSGDSHTRSMTERHLLRLTSRRRSGYPPMVVGRYFVTPENRTLNISGGPGWSLLEARWNGPIVISHAQNAEDVRLWRVLASRPAGFYVDIGAGHPVDNSVTKLFYDNGWSGLNVEPGPAFERLAAARPRDTTLDLAVASESSEAEMWVTSPYPELSTIVRSSHELLPEAISVTRTTVRTARVDELVAKHAPGRQIDFLKIDVEGAERDVLESFDPRVLRPTVVVVEAIAVMTNRPTQQDWEHLLLDADYVFAAFDGINRFYVPAECSDLVPALEYPVSPLDRYVTSDGAARDRTEHLPLVSAGVTRNELRQLQEALREAREALTAIQGTLSWRVTRPLRVLRRLQLKTSSRARAPRAEPTELERARFEGACAARLRQAARLLTDQLAPPGALGEAPSLSAALDEVRDALTTHRTDVPGTAWLLLTAVDGSYPRERDVENATQILRTSGPAPFTRCLESRFAEAVDAGIASAAGLDILTNQIVVDVSQIAASDLHTGIQRVARECVSRWLRAGSPLRLAYFDHDAGALRSLGDEERDRLRRWQDHLENAGEVGMRRPLASDNILVPWSCDLVLPELPTLERSAALRGLVVSKAHRSLCLVCFDLIPILAPETVEPRIVGTFAEYLALLKRADRISAISKQTADDVRAFTSLLHGQGLPSPEIVEHSLPTEAPMPADAVPASASGPPERQDPLILVVGVHVPRKNHAAVLEAGERLWRRGHRFELVFMGGSMWRAEGHFDAYVERLQAEGVRVRVERRVSEKELWGAYTRARFTVFPSLIEGFGLPVAESIAAGTPVITSNYGSMAELAGGGGALLVDPRNVDDLEEQMRRLLTDDVLVEQLRREARERDLGNWDEYARDVWEFFTR